MYTKSTPRFLRQLRRLDRDWQTARRRLQNVRALVESLPAERDDLAALSDLSELEAAEAAAREAYDAHAAQQPALSQEYADRAELADVLADIRRREHTLGLLLTAPVTAPAASSRLAAAETAVKQAATARAALVAQASAVDAEYQAGIAEGQSWHVLGAIEAQAAKLRAAIGKAETRLADAERRERDARERGEAREAAAARRTAEIELARGELARARAYADDLRARLPETVSAPLREPRAGYGGPAPLELHGAIRERYRYDPIAGTLHRLPRGELVLASQTVMIDGRRLSRAAVLAVLAPPAPYNPDPEDLA